ARLRHPGPLREVQSAQARRSLAEGDRAVVERWASQLAAQPGPVFAAQQEREALILARLRLRQGNAAGALELLEPWRADAHAQGRVRSEIENLLIRTQAGLGVQSNALTPNAPTTPPDPALTRALA